MPDIPFREHCGRTGWISVPSEYKPGDMPPSGYNDWHEWAKVQDKAGLKQKRCGYCGRLKFPQEISRTEYREMEAYPTKRDAEAGTNVVTVTEEVPVCLGCDNMENTDGNV